LNRQGAKNAKINKKKMPNRDTEDIEKWGEKGVSWQSKTLRFELSEGFLWV
jgi:hypothetical protein